MLKIPWLFIFLWYHLTSLLHHSHAIAHHYGEWLTYILLWDFSCSLWHLHTYKDKQSFTYKYQGLIPWNISPLAPQSVITYNKHCLASIFNSIVSSVLSHWVLPHYAVVSAPFEKLRSRNSPLPNLKGWRRGLTARWQWSANTSCNLQFIDAIKRVGKSKVDLQLVERPCFLLLVWVSPRLCSCTHRGIGMSWVSHCWFVVLTSHVTICRWSSRCSSRAFPPNVDLVSEQHVPR